MKRCWRFSRRNGGNDQLETLLANPEENLLFTVNRQAIFVVPNIFGLGNVNNVLGDTLD
jgi:hypothetical protein